MNKIVNILLLVLVISVAHAAGQGNSPTGKIVGTWEVQVTVLNCLNQAPVASFAALATFDSSGTLIVTESGTPPSLKAPAHGVWAYVAGSSYKFRTRSFTFDAGGNFTGWIIINNDVAVDHRGNRFNAVGSAGVFNATGTQVFAGCSSLSGTRFTLW